VVSIGYSGLEYYYPEDAILSILANKVRLGSKQKFSASNSLCGKHD